MRSWSTIRKSGYRFSEKHAVGLDPRDHAQSRTWSAIVIQSGTIALTARRSIQLALRHRCLEGRDFGGSRRLAVEGQHVAFSRNDHAIAVADGAFEDHLGQRILHETLNHPLQRPGAIGGIPA